MDGMPIDIGCTSPSVNQLAIVSREFADVADRLAELAATARGLAALTDWRARAATVFHERAEEWAGDVSGLGRLAEEARFATERARERVAYEVLWSCR